MQFDENFLAEMGLSDMPNKQDFLAYIQRELEIRIGERISRGLSKEQLDEFDKIAGQAETTTWLETNCPNYRVIIEKTINEMKAEISANRERLLASRQ